MLTRLDTRVFAHQARKEIAVDVTGRLMLTAISRYGVRMSTRPTRSSAAARRAAN